MADPGRLATMSGGRDRGRVTRDAAALVAALVESVAKGGVTGSPDLRIDLRTPRRFTWSAPGGAGMSAIAAVLAAHGTQDHGQRHQTFGLARAAPARRRPS